MLTVAGAGCQNTQASWIDSSFHDVYNWWRNLFDLFLSAVQREIHILVATVNLRWISIQIAHQTLSNLFLQLLCITSTNYKIFIKRLNNRSSAHGQCCCFSFCCPISPLNKRFSFDMTQHNCLSKNVQECSKLKSSVPINWPIRRLAAHVQLRLVQPMGKNK